MKILNNTPLNKSKILVTGGAGFIGSHLCAKLLELDAQVVCLDNLSTGKIENISPFINQKKFSFIQGDIRHLEVCEQAVRNVDAVLHQAALGSVPRSIDNPSDSIAVNVAGFVNVVNAARRHGVKKIVYASSSSVYGDHPALPKREDNIGRQMSPYALSKYADELFGEQFASLYGLSCTALRYFNVFGPRQDPFGAYAAVIPRFADALLRHQQPKINGDGAFSRDFTFVDNVVQANLKALNFDAPYRVFNIGAGGRTTIMELFRLIRATLAGLDPEIAAIEPLFGEIRAGDVPHSHADIERARAELGYEPEVSVAEGIKRTMTFYQAMRG